MSANDISVPSTVITDIDEEWIKDTNNLSSYDIWCDTSESKIHMEGDISDRLEKFKPLKEEGNMTHGWVTRIFRSWSAISDIWEVILDGHT